jgi:hypothetical protein
MTRHTQRAASAIHFAGKVLDQNVEAGGGHPGPYVIGAPCTSSDIKEKLNILDAWPGGPLREFASKRVVSSWMPYQAHAFTGEDADKRRFSGSYVCSLCRNKVNGIYQPNKTVEAWHCSDCRERRRAENFHKGSKNGRRS